MARGRYSYLTRGRLVIQMLLLLFSSAGVPPAVAATEYNNLHEASRGGAEAVGRWSAAYAMSRPISEKIPGQVQFEIFSGFTTNAAKYGVSCFEAGRCGVIVSVDVARKNTELRVFRIRVVGGGSGSSFWQTTDASEPLSLLSGYEFDGDASFFAWVWKKGTEKNRIVLNAAIQAELPAQLRGSANARRRALADYAKKELDANVNGNLCAAFVRVVEQSSRLVDSLPKPSDKMLDDLLQVLVGTGVSPSERGKGEYFVGRHSGSGGFKSWLADRSPQVSHAYAGIYIGARYPYGTEQFASLLSEIIPALIRFARGQPNAAVEWQDMALFSIGGAVGRRMNDGNYKEVGGRVRHAMCE